MKKLLTVALLCLFHTAFAGTGGAKDTDLLYLVVLGFLAVILALLYTISFAVKLLKIRKQRRLAHLTDTSEDAHIGDGFL